MKFIFSIRLACNEQLPFGAIRGAKVKTYFDFQTYFSTFVDEARLDFKAMNPIDSGGVQR